MAADRSGTVRRRPSVGRHAYPGGTPTRLSLAKCPLAPVHPPTGHITASAPVH
jgi:hypothetical protein